jgi:hypothetical protein
VGAPHPTGAVTTVESSDEVPAAVALLGADGRVERATARFLERFGTDEPLLGTADAELSRILEGECDQLTVALGGAEAELSAVTTADARRCALVVVPVAANQDPGEDLTDLLLGEPIDASPAIIWLKDLDGRYLRVNRRYEEQLRTPADQVCGKTDADLSPGESIDGSRLRTNDLVPKEPLELEYTVAASDNRPAFTVLRFALRDRGGKAVAVCGVAAPLDQAQLARSECERLMRIERWSRLDERAIREELLDEWGLAPTGNGSGTVDEAPEVSSNGHPAADVDIQQLAASTRSSELEQLQRETVEMLRVELTAVQETVERARTEASAEALLGAERDKVEALQTELRAAREEVQLAHAAAEAQRAAKQQAQEELEQQRVLAGEAEAAGNRARREAAATAAEVQAERQAIEALQAELRAAHTAVADARDELSRVRVERSTLREQIEQLEGETAEDPARAHDQRADGSPTWTAASQRALTAALTGVSEWRSALLQVVKILGSEGGWDAAVAWSPDERRGLMKCVAMWTADDAGLSSFETRTWQHRQDVAGTEFGRARNRAAPTCLLELQTAEDGLLRAASAEGLGSAMLVPIADGGETIAMLELMSRRVGAPDADLMLFLESVALQLGAVARLLNSAASPRWRTGRV